MQSRQYIAKVALLAAGILAVANACLAADPIRVLLLTGKNNHDWRHTTPCLQEILADKDTFNVRITEQPQTCTAKDFAVCDIILSNWNNWGDNGPDAQWPETTRTAFLDFVKNGGGHVMVHAGGSSFYNWPAYHRIVASWGAKTSHGPNHTFQVDIADPNHPLVKGLTPFAIHDELWNQAQFPAKSDVLLTAYSDTAYKGTGKAEPVLCVSQYERGRCVNLMLGHDVTAMQNPGFQRLLRRSCLWAARRPVVLPREEEPKH